jgi:hypothetical protein
VFLTSGKHGEIVKHCRQPNGASLGETPGLFGGNSYLFRSCGVRQSLAGLVQERQLQNRPPALWARLTSYLIAPQFNAQISLDADMASKFPWLMKLALKEMKA